MIALDLINRGRAALDLPPLAELPRAIPGVCNDCVIARCFPNSRVSAVHISFERDETTYQALGEAWGVGMAYQNESRIGFALPPQLQDFIAKFDRHEIPELLDVKPDDLFIRHEPFLGYRWIWADVYGSPWYSTLAEAETGLAKFREAVGLSS